MASILKHLRSSTADKRPTASGLADGQFAINTASGTPGVFFKDSNGGVMKVGPVHVGATAPNAVPAGSAGNSLGELWVDNSLTTAGLNYYTGSAFVNLTPSGTTTTVGLVELATPAETQTGTDAVRAVTPSGLQSKVSDSTSTTSSTTIASSTAVKSAYDLANAALPKAGGTVTGELLIGNTGSVVFEGSTDNGFETTIAVTDPTADRTITFPNVTGTVVTTGDSGTVTSTMIANDTIVNADINSAAAIAYGKLALSSGIVNTDISASAAIVDTKLATISTADKVSLSALNIDGATDIGGPLEGGDLFIVDDGAGGTNRKASAFRMSQLAYSGVTGDIAIASGGTASISAGVIVNTDVNASAAIAYSKLALSSGIINTDISASAAIAYSKLATLTAGNIILGNASNVATSTAVTGDVTISNAGVTAIASGVIVNADVNDSAAIAGTKISPDFGAQNVVTTGASTAARFIPTSSGIPANGLYLPAANSIGLATNSASRLQINSSGTLVLAGTAGNSISIDGTASANRFSVDNNGNIGIGTAAAAGAPINMVSSTGPAIGLGANNGAYLGAVYGTTYTADEHFFLAPTGGYPYYKALVTGPNAVPENVFNDDGANLDFRIEGDTNANLFFVDASTDRVGIGTSSPDALLTVNGIGAFGAGTASLPSITFTGDLNTGIYSPGADQVAVATNGTGRLFINSSGSVGIGTGSPGTAATGTFSGLHIEGTATNGDLTTLLLRNPDTTADTAAKVSIEMKASSSSRRGAKITAFKEGTYADATQADIGLQLSTVVNDAYVDAVTIKQDGKVGIGTTSPANTLHVAGTARIANSAGGELILEDSDEADGNRPFQRIVSDSGSLVFLNANRSGTSTTSSQERARIDSSGRLLVGTSTAETATIGGLLQVQGTGSSAAGMIKRNSANASGPYIYLAKSRGATVGSTTIVQSGDSLGEVRFAGADGSTEVGALGALIKAEVDGTPGANDMPGRLVFSVTADGASSPTERMRINSSGECGVFTADVSGLACFEASQSGGAGSTRLLFQGRYSATGTYSGTESFRVESSGDVKNANNSYGAISDIKLKENIVDANAQWDDIKALRVRNYNFKEGQTHTQIGLVAQEVESISPGLVSEFPDLDAEGNDLGTVTKSVNYSVLYMKAVKALQEAMERIEVLEARLNAANL